LIHRFDENPVTAAYLEPPSFQIGSSSARASAPRLDDMRLIPPITPPRASRHWLHLE